MDARLSQEFEDLKLPSGESLASLELDEYLEYICLQELLDGVVDGLFSSGERPRNATRYLVGQLLGIAGGASDPLEKPQSPLDVQRDDQIGLVLGTEAFAGDTGDGLDLAETEESMLEEYLEEAEVEERLGRAVAELAEARPPLKAVRNFLANSLIGQSRSTAASEDEPAAEAAPAPAVVGLPPLKGGASPAAPPQQPQQRKANALTPLRLVPLKR